MGLLWGHYRLSYLLLQGCVGNWVPEHSHSAIRHNTNPVSRANSKYSGRSSLQNGRYFFVFFLGERRQAKRARRKRYAQRGLRSSFARKSWKKMTPVLRLGRSDWSHRSDYIIWKSGLLRNVFSIIRPGARDSENSNLTLGDLASLFTQDDEQDEEQCMTGSYNFVDQSGPSTELQWKHKCIRSLGPF